MLLELSVENYAVVEKVRVRFHRGLNLLTGETGSGKSIVVDALALLLGGRAAAEMVRSGAERARISGIFEVDGQTLPEGVEPEDGELIIEREILPNGKSRAFAGGRPVTAALLKELARSLGDIHGQHDQQQLFSGSVQREMLDGFAGAGEQVSEAGSLYSRWNAASQELAELERTAQEKLRQADLWTFQRNEIEAVNPQADEDTQLDNERRVLRNVVKLEETAGAAYAALYEDPASVTAQLHSVVKRLEDLGRIDESMQDVVATLEPARIAVDEAAHALSHYLGKLEADPARLEEIETRLAALEKLRRKYGTTIEDVIAFRDDVAQNLAAVESSGAGGVLRICGGAPNQAAQGRGAAAGEGGRGRIGFARHGQNARGNSGFGGGVVSYRRGCGGDPDLTQRGRRIEAAREDRVGRRVVTRGAGAQDLRRSRPRR
jgi:DNA repair protein RecN (Recombination protein N)